MYKKLLFFFCMLHIHPPLYSQHCDCSTNLNYLITSVTKNYAGYEDKITAQVKPSFEKFTDSLRNKAKNTTDKDCYKLLKSWLAYFNDRHLAIVFNDSIDHHNFIRSVFSDEPSIALDKITLEKRFRENAGKHTLEGIWKIENSLYEVAIIKRNTKEYLGVITTADSVFWVPGQIKFELRAKGNGRYHVIFRKRDHSKEESDMAIDPSATTLLMAGATWKKMSPDGNTTLNNENKGEDEGIYFKSLSKETNILRISSFALPNKKIIDSLIEKNFTALTNTPNLIVDIRGNIGGFSVSYAQLLPLLYTNPIITKNVSIRITDENIALYEELLKVPEYPVKEKEDIKILLEQMKSKKTGYVEEPDEEYKQEKVYTYPKKIAMVVDSGSASASEILILMAKQSKKVTLFGGTTLGAVDYTELVAARKQYCPHYLLWCPTGKSKRLPDYPIDNIGIKPDIKINNTENDWISFVRNYLEKKN
ncbi:S41 family peptidase [Chitinophaga sp. Cy-1792]|uniref:S41 family peptidase n=1 Tax=Chitinophaga sp. Cy-1792 TaxID=2608339 RepID=UPI0014224506|nr:S41 family peptidase [Chitinophaga sp. Cy-1792]NIG55032.1 hypothetical protein [Chitinophaga sp. Cy-1792]